MLAALVDEAALHDLGVAEDVVVASAQNADHGLALDVARRILERGERERARGLGDDALVLVELDHGGADSSLGDEDDPIDVLPAKLEGELAGGADCRPIDE